IMLTRHIEDFAGLDALQVLLKRIEFFRLRKMTQVTRMQDKLRPGRQTVNLGDRFLESSDDILVRVFVEPDVAVADLNEAEIARCYRVDRAKDFGGEHATTQGPKHTSACPGHAFQETTTIDAVGVLIV